MVSENSEIYKKIYKYILELHMDGEKHRQVDIKNKFEPLLFPNEEELSDKEKQILNSYVTFPLQHFRENGFLEKVEVEKGSWTRITEDGIKLYNLNLPIIGERTLKKYRRKFDKGDIEVVDGKLIIFKDTKISNSESNYFIIENKVVEKNILDKYVKDHQLDSICIGGNEFEIICKESNNKNYIIINDEELCLKNTQSSINISNDFYEYAKVNKIIIESDMYHARKEEDGNAYVLNDYKLNLGDGILLLIGEEFRNSENKFLASMNNNGKFQIYNVVYDLKENPENYKTHNKYKDLNLVKEEGYGWFLELIPRTICGSKLIICVDNESKEVKLDLEFNQIKHITSLKELLEVDDSSIGHPHNRIVFGAPGTGKSFKLETDKRPFVNNYERVTFHPNYSYSQFVGTYKPVPVKDKGADETRKITYKYVPGPFMRTYVEAINTGEPYLLLIEEINRANVTAVFGDVFQLLDRRDGESEYPIETSEDMRDYLEEHIEIEDFDCTRIKIPSNMYIWATMNSADQGVFPMDTAFKRRWDFEYIGINDEEDKIINIEFMACGDKETVEEEEEDKDKETVEEEEEDKDKETVEEEEEDKYKAHRVNWNDLRRGINHVLSNDCKINEDKLLGPYFLSGDLIKTNKEIKKPQEFKKGEENLIFDNKKFIEAFKSKVLMYLFEDAAKQQQHKQKLFRGCEPHTYAKYSSICKEFDKKGEAIFGKDILSKGKK